MSRLSNYGIKETWRKNLVSFSLPNPQLSGYIPLELKNALLQWCADFPCNAHSSEMPSCAILHCSARTLSSSLELLRKFSCLAMVSTKKHNLLWPPGSCIIVTVQREWQRGGGQGTMVLVLGPTSNSWACKRNANPGAQSEFVLLEPLHTPICYMVWQMEWSSHAK